MAEFNFPRPHTDEAIKNLEELEELEFKYRDYRFRKAQLLEQLESAVMKDLATTFEHLAGQKFIIRFRGMRDVGPRIHYLHSIVSRPNRQESYEQAAAGVIANPFSRDAFLQDIEDYKEFRTNNAFRISEDNYFYKKESFFGVGFEEKTVPFFLVRSPYYRDTMELSLTDFVLLVVPKEKWILIKENTNLFEERAKMVSFFLGDKEVGLELERMKTLGEADGLPW
jgi:hypothetical protein